MHEWKFVCACDSPFDYSDEDSYIAGKKARKMKCPKCQADNPGDTKFCGNCGSSLFPPQKDQDDATKTLITPAKELAIGSIFSGRYRILEELGRGGMGKVYKAIDTKIDEKVAIKLLNPEVAADTITRERFRNELKLTRSISHRHICRVYDFSEEEGHSYFTMEYISGEDLKSLIRKIGQFTPGKAVFIARQVCEGLTEAHRLGIIHRDLKPHNVMIDKEGNVRIMDFGIARSMKKRGVTDPGVIIGTPEYMSPEQVEGKEIDERTDIYSLGIILYEMLTGKVPFEGDTPLSVAVKQKTERPVDPRRLNTQIHESISSLILKCLEKDRENRCQNADELLVELKKIDKAIPSTDRVIPERKTGTAKEITVKFSPKKFLVPGLIVIAAVIVSLIAWQVLSHKGEGLLAMDKPSLAVMHFENNTGDQNLDHWKKALSDLLISDLGQSRFLQVLSAERLYNILEDLNLLEAERYSSENLLDVAERAGMRYVLVGRMTKAGETIRFNSTIQEARSGDVIGSQQVEAQGEDSLFAMVDELTTKVKADLDLSEKDIAADIDAHVQDISTSSTEALEYYQEGIRYQRKADYTKSIPLFELAVAIDPEFAMGFRALSVAYGNLSYASEAFKHLEKAFELKDRVSEKERYYIEADYFRHSEKTYPEAIQAYTELLKLYPDDSIGNNNLGVLYTSIEEHDKAIERYKVNKSNKVPGFQSYSNLAGAYISQGKLDKAVEECEYFLENISEIPELYGTLAQIYLLQEKYDKALAELEKAIKLSPSFINYHILKGSVYLAQDQLDLAEEEIQKSLESDQPFAHYLARQTLFNLSLLKGKFFEAEYQLLEGLELADMVGENWWKVGSYLNLALSYSLSGRIADAQKSLDRAESLAADSEDSEMKRNVLFLKGVVLAMQGRIPDVKQIAADLKILIEAGMNNKEIRLYHVLTGLYLSGEARYDEAIGEFEKSTKLMPYQDGLRILVKYSMAKAYHKSGDLTKSQKIYEDIVSNGRSKMDNGHLYAMSKYELGKVYLAKGLEEKARRSFESFLELWQDADSELPEIAEVEEKLSAL